MKSVIKYGLLAIAISWSFAACNSGEPDNSGEQASVLLSNPRNQASVVYLTSDEKDNPIASWAEIDSTGHKLFFLSRWDNAAGKFGSPVSVPITQNTSIHEEGMPKVAIKGDGTILAILEVSVPAPGLKWGIGDVQYIQSGDGGKTWSEPQSVCISRTPMESMSFSGVTRLSDGEIAVSWLDANPDGEMGRGRPVMFARTTAGGGFEKPILIEKQACECCRVAITGGTDGYIGIAYRDLLPGSVRDISIATSMDGGKTFDRPGDFSKDDWQIDGCPHNGPSIVAGNGQTYTAWYSGGKRSGVHYAELDRQGNMISKEDLSRDGRFIQLTLMPDGTRIVAYNETYKSGDSLYSHIVLNKIDGKNFQEKIVTSPGMHGSYPVVRPIDQEKFLLAWRDGDKIYYQKTGMNDITEPGRKAVYEPAISPLEKINATALWKDPVCEMPMNKSLTVDSTVYKGKVIHFCSDHCKQSFLQSPEKFIARVD